MLAEESSPWQNKLGKDLWMAGGTRRRNRSLKPRLHVGGLMYVLALIIAISGVICSSIVRVCVQHNYRAMLSTATAISFQKMRCLEKDRIADV